MINIWTKRQQSVSAAISAIALMAAMFATMPTAASAQADPSLAVEPASVPSQGEHLLTITGGGWTPGNSLFVLPCTAPGNDVDAISSGSCDITDLTAVTVGNDGAFTVDIEYNVFPSFAVAAGDAAQTESAAVLVPIEPPQTAVATPTFSTPIGIGSIVEFTVEVAGFTPDSTVFLRPCATPFPTACDATLQSELIVDQDGEGSATVTYRISQGFSIGAFNASRTEQARARVVQVGQSFSIQPYEVPEAGEHELTAIGFGWRLNKPYFAVPCIAPGGDPRAIIRDRDCDLDDSTEVTPQGGRHGQFRLTRTYDIGENFALWIGDTAQNETFAVSVPISTTPLCSGSPASHIGTDGNDTMTGTSGDDVFVGLGGDDRIIGMGGDDIICGGPGNDRIFAGAGNDRVEGGPGVDKVRGGPGRDTLLGDNGNDFLKGGDGNDLIVGLGGHDRIRGGEDNDILRGSGGDDRIWGGPGNDRIYAGAGSNIINGGDGDQDECYFGLGPDLSSNCEIVAVP